MICFGIMLSAYVSDVNEQYLALFEKNVGEINIYLNKYNKVVNYIEMAKQEITNDYYDETEYDDYTIEEIDEEFIKEIEENTDMDWSLIYDIQGENGNISLEYVSSLKSTEEMNMYYYVGQYTTEFKFIVSDTKNDKVIGNMPQNDDEIVISSYVADNIINQGVYAKVNNEENTKEEKYQPTNYNELISGNMYLKLSDVTYAKVVGIIDYNEEINEKYGKLKDVIAGDLWEYPSIYSDEEYNEIYNLYDNFWDDVVDKYLIVYVSQSFITKMQNIETTYSSTAFRYQYNNDSYYGDMIAYIEDSINIINENGLQKVSTLNTDEIIIDVGILSEITNYAFWDVYYNNVDNYESDEEFIQEYLKDNEIIGKTIKINITNNGELVANDENYTEYKIAGIVWSENIDEYNMVMYFNKDVIQPLMTSIVSCNTAVTTIDNVEELKTILEYYPIDDSDIISSSTYSEEVLTSAIISYFIRYIGKYGVIFFLIFTSIILMNFINSSIRFRKKEIGTLRALGCRGRDIIKMFIYESLVLMIIMLIISFLIIPNVLDSINEFMATDLQINVEIFRLGIRQILEITGIMVIIVFLANIIPLMKVTRMKPIDAILNK